MLFDYNLTTFWPEITMQCCYPTLLTAECDHTLQHIRLQYTFSFDNGSLKSEGQAAAHLSYNHL